MATATAIENSSIASAREKAASILYGNEKAVTPVIAEYQVPVKEEPKNKPTFASYYHAEPMRQYQPVQMRSYESYVEPTMVREPQVVRPLIDGNQIEVATPVETVTPVAVTSKNVQSEIDMELEEGTQYVVRFKPATIVAAASVAAIFLLLAVLFIVNIVSLCAGAATVNGLLQEQQSLKQQLNTTERETQALEEKRLTELRNEANLHEKIETQTIAPEEVRFYTPTTANEESGGLFDWLCKSLSNLFG